MISRNTIEPYTSVKRPAKKKRKSTVDKTNSYLEDVLIEDDVKNVNLLFNPPQEQAKPKSVERTDYMQEFTPRQRIQIKKDLNDHYQENFNVIERKDYDRIMAGRKEESRLFEQSSFNFNKFSGW